MCPAWFPQGWPGARPRNSPRSRGTRRPCSGPGPCRRWPLPGLPVCARTVGEPACDRLEQHEHQAHDQRRLGVTPEAHRDRERRRGVRPRRLVGAAEVGLQCRRDRDSLPEVAGGFLVVHRRARYSAGRERFFTLRPGRAFTVARLRGPTPGVSNVGRTLRPTNGSGFTERLRGSLRDAGGVECGSGGRCERHGAWSRSW